MSSTSATPLLQSQDNSTPVQPPYSAVLELLWQKRVFLVKFAAVGLILSTILAFIIPKQYKSTVQLMPPDPLMTSPDEVFAATMGGSMSSGAAGLSGILSGDRTPGAIFVGILQSRTVQDTLITRFDLKKVFSCKFNEEARLRLAGESSIQEDKKTGIIIIEVTDRSPELARDLAAAYVQELNNLVATESTSAAKRERIFLESRLKQVWGDIDSTSRELSQFSSRNATLDPETQGKAALEAAEKLQGDLIAAQSELRGFETTYSEDNTRVRALHAKVDELQSQLSKLTGSSGEPKSEIGSGQLSPSIRSMPLLGVTYNELFLRVAIQRELFELLTKRYESARIQEEKEIPTVQVLDAPVVPERKASPHRLLIMLAGMMLFFMGGATLTIAQAHLEASGDHSLRRLFIKIKQEALGDLKGLITFRKFRRKGY